MSKLTPALSGLACFLWVSGWTWIFSAEKQQIPISDNPIPFKVWLNSEQYNVQQPFVFDLSEAMPVMTEQLHPVLKDLAKKLQDNPTDILTVTGIYSSEEQNETKFDNLGIARASSVKAMLTTAGVDDRKVRIAAMEANNLLLVKEKLVGVVYFQFASSEGQPMLKIEQTVADENEPTELGQSSFSFKSGNYKVEKQHLKTLNDLRRQLRDDPNLHVLLTGYSAQDEESTSAKVDLAELRALAIRRYLVDHGIRRAQIKVKSKPGMAENEKEKVVTVQLTRD